MAAIEIRSCGRLTISEMKPEPSSPSRFSFGTCDVVEEQLGGVLRLEADLLEVAAALEARHAALDDEQADALVAGVGVGARDHDRPGRT